MYELFIKKKLFPTVNKDGRFYRKGTEQMAFNIDLSLRDAPPIVWVFLIALVLALFGKLFNDNTMYGIGGVAMIIIVVVVVVALLVDALR